MKTPFIVQLFGGDKDAKLIGSIYTTIEEAYFIIEQIACEYMEFHLPKGYGLYKKYARLR